MDWDDTGLTIYVGRDAVHFEITFVLAVLAGLIAVDLIAFARSSGRKSRCRWRRLREREEAPFAKWRCKDCLMEAFTTDRRPPKECKRELRSGL